jgi:hypothetical protein
MVKHYRKNDNPNYENENSYAQQFPETPAKEALAWNKTDWINVKKDK